MKNEIEKLKKNKCFMFFLKENLTQKMDIKKAITKAFQDEKDTIEKWLNIINDRTYIPGTMCTESSKNAQNVQKYLGDIVYHSINQK
jgi:hypothetical protein